MSYNVRTFQAASMPAALELVKREMGPDAVILGTRCIPAGRIGGLVGRQRVEITASPAHEGGPALRLGRPGGSNGDARRTQPAAVKAAPASPAPSAAATASTPPALPEEVYPYYVKLVQNEVAEELAARVLGAAARAMPAHMLADPKVLPEVLRRCIARLVPTAETAEIPEGGMRRISLVGPPGGGKTTMLAKLAAQFKLRRGRRVALLSLDMHRLAANEQLKRYAELIDVPMESAQTVNQVKRALEKLAGADCLLVDTPGVGPREQGRFARMAALLRAVRPDELHLVLPACLSGAAQKRLAEAFAPLGVTRLALTHLDEAVGFGVVLNAADRLKGKLSYLAAGQNVPRDIEEACGNRIAELILPV
ncbi:MAG: hypothetical protein PVJ57_21190 [Phycisphaerae bacterium]